MLTYNMLTANLLHKHKPTPVCWDTLVTVTGLLTRCSSHSVWLFDGIIFVVNCQSSWMFSGEGCELQTLALQHDSVLRHTWCNKSCRQWKWTDWEGKPTKISPWWARLVQNKQARENCKRKLLKWGNCNNNNRLLYIIYCSVIACLWICVREDGKWRLKRMKKEWKREYKHRKL